MTKNLLNLKQSVFGEKNFEPEYEGLRGEHFLTMDSPAQICGDKIYILDILSATEKDDALGNELIKSRGLIRCEGYLNEISVEKLFLLGEINNSLSHKEIIWVLSNEFNLSSAFHLHLQSNALLNGGIEQKIANCSGDKFALYAIGLELFDIQRTADGNYEEEIRNLYAKNSYIKKGMDVGLKYLNSTKEEQIKALACVITEFELYNLLDTRYYYPLPIEISYKEEDVSHLVFNEIKSILIEQAQK